MAARPHLLLLDEPTRGVDVGAKAEIYRLIEEQRKEGMAILVASSELEELLSICHRIVVIRQGRITAELRSFGVLQGTHHRGCRIRPGDRRNGGQHRGSAGRRQLTSAPAGVGDRPRSGGNLSIRRRSASFSP